MYEDWLDTVPLETIMRMLPIVSKSAYKDDWHTEWNGLVWTVAAWHGVLWDSNRIGV